MRELFLVYREPGGRWNWSKGLRERLAKRGLTLSAAGLAPSKAATARKKVAITAAE